MEERRNMRKVTIYKREILVRTGFRKYPYRKETQFIIYHGGRKVLANCSESIDNPNLRIKFEKIYESKSLPKLTLLSNELSKKRDNASADLEILVKMAIRMFGNGEPKKIQNSTAYGVMNGRILK